MAREKNIYIHISPNVILFVVGQTHNTCNEKSWCSIYFPDTEIFRYLETKQHSWLFMSFINKNRKTETKHRYREVCDICRLRRGDFSTLEHSKKNPKKGCKEAWTSHQRRCGAERLACFAEKKIGGGHRPQCLIRQCFYPASTLKLGQLLGWEQLQHCTPEAKRTLG